MAKIQTMASMELDDDDKLDFCAPMPCDKPDFPFGLQISVSEKEMDKMNLDPAGAEVGGIVHGHFMGRITSVSARETDGKSTCRVEIQIEAMCLEFEDEENAEEEASERG